MSTGGDETQFMGGGGDDATQVGGGPSQPADDGGDKKKMWLIVLGIVTAGVIIGAGIAVAGGGGDDDEKTADSTSTSVSTSTSTSTSTTLAPATTGATAPSDDPQIASFSGNKSSPFNCASPAPDVSTSIPGIDFTLSWTTQNTSSTELSVDGPGVYNTYGPNDSASFTYSCSDQEHTYTLTAKGPNGPDTSRTITFRIDDTTT